MDPDPVERKLAALLSADVVGYSRLMADDEEGTVRRLKQHREIIDGLIATHHGRLFGTAGDSVIAEFASPVEAVRCAVDIQRRLTERNAELLEERRMQFRIGVNLGDVMVEGNDLLGDGVNISARVQGLAEPGGICISANVYEHVHNKLDLAYDDLGAQAVKNIPEPVRVYALRLDGGIRRRRHPARRKRSRLRVALATFAGLILLVGVGLWASWPRPLGLLIDILGVSGPPINPPLPDQPSIAVLPFTNMSGDPEQEYFSDGITEDLTSALSRTPMLFVISRNSAFTYKGVPVKVEDVGRELGVRYVVEGSVRRAGGRVRIAAQLIDATTGFHLWSQSYDRDLADVFAVQSEISEEIMVAVGMEIQAAEIQRIRHKPTTNLSAYDAYLRGFQHFRRFTREGFKQARPLYQRAIELDPKYAAAYASLGTTYFLEYLQGWNLAPALLDRAMELAERALELDPDQPNALNDMGGVLVLRDRLSEARVFTEKAIEAAPNWNVPHFALAFHQVADGEFLGAIRSANRALRLNPRPPAVELGSIAGVNFAVGRADRAVELWERARASNPDTITSRIWLAAVYESQGRHREARAVAQEILRVNPQLTAELAIGIGPIPYVLDAGRRAEFREHLRSDGLP